MDCMKGLIYFRLGNNLSSYMFPCDLENYSSYALSRLWRSRLSAGWPEKKLPNQRLKSISNTYKSNKERLKTAVDSKAQIGLKITLL